MRALFEAISFLTIIPIGKLRKNEYGGELHESLTWFPLVGLIPGGLMLGIALLSPQLLTSYVAAFLGLLAAVFITGGLHLDGLADWADGLAGRDSEAILRIMKDMRVGAFGITAITLLLIGKYGAIHGIIAGRQGLAGLVLAPVIARWTLTIIAATSSYSRPEGGTAREFLGKGNPQVILKATALMVIVALLASPLCGIIYIVMAAGTAWLFRHNSIKRVGGITGDILGANCEMVELVVLMGSSVINK